MTGARRRPEPGRAIGWGHETRSVGNAQLPPSKGGTCSRLEGSDSSASSWLF
jgi:hypothetical protein